MQHNQAQTPTPHSRAGRSVPDSLALPDIPSRAYPGRGMVPQEAEGDQGGGWRRGSARAQGPPGSEGTEPGSEPVAEPEWRGEE
jgi:hypothetical protein